MSQVEFNVHMADTFIITKVWFIRDSKSLQL